MKIFSEYRKQQSIGDALRLAAHKRERKAEKLRRRVAEKQIIRRNNIEALKRFFGSHSFVNVLMWLALGMALQWLAGKLA